MPIAMVGVLTNHKSHAPLAMARDTRAIPLMHWFVSSRTSPPALVRVLTNNSRQRFTFSFAVGLAACRCHLYHRRSE
jgi:hypothetical protein